MGEKKKKKNKADNVVCDITLFHNLRIISDRLMHNLAKKKKKGLMHDGFFFLITIKYL